MALTSHYDVSSWKTLGLRGDYLQYKGFRAVITENNDLHNAVILPNSGKSSNLAKDQFLVKKLPRYYYYRLKLSKV